MKVNIPVCRRDGLADAQSDVAMTQPAPSSSFMQRCTRCTGTDPEKVDISNDFCRFLRGEQRRRFKSECKKAKTNRGCICSISLSPSTEGRGVKVCACGSALSVRPPSQIAGRPLAPLGSGCARCRRHLGHGRQLKPCASVGLFPAAAAGAGLADACQSSFSCRTARRYAGGDVVHENVGR